MKGTPVNEFVTYVNRGGIKPAELFYGNGQGIVTTGESEVATFTGKSFGRVHPSGNIKVGHINFLSNNFNRQTGFSKQSCRSF